MTVDIGVDAEIDRVRLKEVASPSTPTTGYGYVYAKTDGLYFKGDNGTEIGPLAAADAGIANSNISPTTTNVTAAVNTRYFADTSGLTANRNFVLPSGTVGDEIELNISVGDDTYFLVVIGDTGVTINGGSAATAWAYLREAGMTVRLILTTTTNWQAIKYEKKTELDYVEFTSSVSITATTEATANTVVTSSAVVYDGVTPVTIEFFSPAIRPDTGAAARDLSLWLYQDGSSIGRIGFIEVPDVTVGTNMFVPVHSERRITPSAGSHTYSVRSSVDTGTGSVIAGAGGTGNNVPGFIRIVKANP